MSIYKDDSEKVFECAAYTVHKRKTHSVTAFAYTPRAQVIQDVTEITSTDHLGLKKTYKRDGTTYYNEFSPGSVASYALENNLCPITAVAKAKERGHKLHWINACAVSITAHARAKDKLIEVHYGMVVNFEGLLATIEADHNDNLKFVPLFGTVEESLNY